mmetsp:Transcript_65356/g.115967  ORF Transcript_65356/g.115967 Transcript_65356/m.115967 type:complete len:173 (-) Transcript_65356:60-578(-)
MAKKEGAGRKGLDTKDSIENFKIALDTEFKTAREWDEKWGFFKAPQRRLRSEMRKEAAEASLAKSSSAPSLTQAGQDMLKASTSTFPAADEEEIEFINDRHRLMHKKRLLPQQRYARPACTNMKYGWKPTIETLGVAQFGMRKIARELMPEDANCVMMDNFYSKNATLGPPE